MASGKKSIKGGAASEYSYEYGEYDSEGNEMKEEYDYEYDEEEEEVNATDFYNKTKLGNKLKANNKD